MIRNDTIDGSIMVLGRATNTGGSFFIGRAGLSSSPPLRPFRRERIRMANNGRGKNPASQKNLEKNAGRFTSETASIAAQKSVEVRRARKTLREELLALLSAGDTQERIATSLIDEAINGNRAGSVKGAFEAIRDTVGEKPKDNLELSGGGSVRFIFGTPDEGEDFSG